MGVLTTTAMEEGIRVYPVVKYFSVAATLADQSFTIRSNASESNLGSSSSNKIMSSRAGATANKYRTSIVGKSTNVSGNSTETTSEPDAIGEESTEIETTMNMFERPSAKDSATKEVTVASGMERMNVDRKKAENVDLGGYKLVGKPISSTQRNPDRRIQRLAEI